MIVSALLLLCGTALNALPLYSLGPNTTAWQPPAAHGLFFGDVRARVVVDAAATAAASAATVHIFWRRRDPRPSNKSVVVTTADGKIVASHVALLQSECGIVTFSLDPTASGVYFVYYLAYYQTGGGAGLHFHWFNCTAETPDCVMDSTLESSAALAHAAPTCDAPLATATASVSGLENRPSAAWQKDHAVGETTFNGFTSMELVALPSERATLPPKALNIFLTPREKMVRMFDAIPAVWARGGEVHSITLHARENEYFTWQVGLFANGVAARDVSVDFSHAKEIRGFLTINSSAFTCFNLGGVDEQGVAFTKSFSLKANSAGSLWIGADLPSGISGSFDLTMLVSGTQLNVKLVISQGPIANRGEDDVYTLARMRWLNSAVGVDTVATWPRSRFDNITHVASTAAAPIVLRLVNKDLMIGAHGLPTQAIVRTVKRRRGVNETRERSILAKPIQFLAFDSSSGAIPLAVQTPAKILTQSGGAVSWSAVLSGGGITVNVVGKLEMDSYLTFECNVSSSDEGKDVTVSDLQLVVAANASVAPRMLGMGAIGSRAHPLEWTWELVSGIGNNRFWMGDVDAGIFVTPRGAGDLWTSPMYGKDYPEYPYIPTSWGGAGAAGQNSSLMGANITNSSSAVVATIFSGARTLSGKAAPTQFLFDLMVTPAHSLDLSRHWDSRYVQVGYGLDYAPPATFQSEGATVITLHQGIGGLHNKTMVNPYINYPFIPEIVDFMENYTSISHALGIQVKFYYTIRELSHHAVELFALKALQGEVILDEDPYTEPQKGYCHDWDCHGGIAYLHEHVIDDYVYCWQQNLMSEEWDGAVCDIGTSRWFNYYLEGIKRSVEFPPHMDGMYVCECIETVCSMLARW